MTTLKYSFAVTKNTIFLVYVCILNVDSQESSPVSASTSSRQQPINFDDASLMTPAVYHSQGRSFYKAVHPPYSALSICGLM